MAKPPKPAPLPDMDEPNRGLYNPIPDYVKNQQSHASLPPVPLDPVTQAFVPGFIADQVSHNYDAKQTYTTKVKAKVLMLDNPLKEAAGKKERQKRKRRGTKRMTAREKRERRVYEVPADCHNYSLFIPLHELWLQYMEELFGQSSNSTVHAQKLVKADYHGAIMTVVRSKCHSYIGVTGIMIQETENVFKIITEQNKLKFIPKAASVFSFRVRDEVYTIYGNHIRYRASERAAKKFKSKPTIDL